MINYWNHSLPKWLLQLQPPSYWIIKICFHKSPKRGIAVLIHLKLSWLVYLLLLFNFFWHSCRFGTVILFVVLHFVFGSPFSLLFFPLFFGAADAVKCFVACQRFFAELPQKPKMLAKSFASACVCVCLWVSLAIAILDIYCKMQRP